MCVFYITTTSVLVRCFLQAPGTSTVEMFWRLLAVCHTVIPDGPQVGVSSRIARGLV